MRQYKVAAISIAVVVLAIISFFVIREIVINNTPHTINKLNATLTSYRSADLEYLEVFNNGTKFKFEKRDEEVIAETGETITKRMWYLVGEESISIDQNVLSTLAVMISNMTAKDVIEVEAKDTSAYGFDDQATYVKATTNDGDEFKFILGDMLFSRDGYYLMKEGDSTVYSVTLFTSNSMLITRGMLLNTNIFPGALSDVTSFSLSKDNEKIFTIIPNDVYYWLITEPIEFRCDAPKTDAMINSTFNLMVKEYVDIDPEDISVYGLDNPKYELTIISRGIETKLYLGNEDIRDASYYAMIEGKSEVFSISASTLNFVDTPAIDILWPFPYTPKLEYVKSVDVKVIGREMFFLKQFNEEYELNEYFFNGESIISVDLTLMTFGQFYYSILIGAEITAVVPELGVLGELHCEMLFTYMDENFETMQYYVTEYDETKLYIVRNGEYTGLVTNVSFFDDQNGLAALTDLILSGKIQEDLAKKNTSEDSDD